MICFICLMAVSIPTGFVGPRMHEFGELTRQPNRAPPGRGNAAVLWGTRKRGSLVAAVHARRAKTAAASSTSCGWPAASAASQLQAVGHAAAGTAVEPRRYADPDIQRMPEPVAPGNGPGNEHHVLAKRNRGDAAHCPVDVAANSEASAGMVGVARPRDRVDRDRRCSSGDLRGRRTRGDGWRAGESLCRAALPRLCRR